MAIVCQKGDKMNKDTMSFIERYGQSIDKPIVLSKKNNK